MIGLEHTKILSSAEILLSFGRFFTYNFNILNGESVPVETGEQLLNPDTVKYKSNDHGLLIQIKKKS